MPLIKKINSGNGPSWVFFGTDEFSVIVLETLKTRGFLPALVLTTPDKPQGRHLTLTPPPVKLWAIKNDIKFIQPPSFKDSSAIDKLKALSCQLFVVASYGKIIPQSVLDLPEHGTLNIHPSLLPKFRGATPLQSAILAGEEKTGVSIMKLDALMDHGSLLGQIVISLTDWQPYYQELHDRSATEGANLLADLLPAYLAGKLIPVEQDHSMATYTQKIEKADGQLDLTGDPEINYRKVRAFTPWPGVFFFIKKDNRELRVSIKKARLENGQLIIEKVVPEGKKEMDWASFQRGYLS